MPTQRPLLPIVATSSIWASSCGRKLLLIVSTAISKEPLHRPPPAGWWIDVAMGRLMERCNLT